MEVDCIFVVMLSAEGQTYSLSAFMHTRKHLNMDVNYLSRLMLQLG